MNPCLNANLVYTDRKIKTNIKLLYRCCTFCFHSLIACALCGGDSVPSNNLLSSAASSFVSITTALKITTNSTAPTVTTTAIAWSTAIAVAISSTAATLPPVIALPPPR
ncbi:hypothetical protein AAHE18_20G020600 [Arachis hypogaea]